VRAGVGARVLKSLYVTEVKLKPAGGRGVAGLGWGRGQGGWVQVIKSKKSFNYFKNTFLILNAFPTYTRS